MLKRLFLAGCALVLALSLVPMAATAEGPQGKLVVYSAGNELFTGTVKELWEKAYPACTLEFISAGSGELTARIAAEASNPQADVMMGGSYSIYSGLVDYLEPYVSPLAAECLPSFSGPNDHFTPYQLNVNTIIVNNQLLKDLGVTVDGWQSLLNEQLKGKISYVDPSASSSAREQVINMLAAQAKINNNSMDDNWAFIESFFKNLDGKMYESSSKVPIGVVNGEHVVGITNEELVLQLMLDGVDVSAVYAKEGITLRNTYMGIVKNGPNPANAKYLVDFMLSKDTQQTLADKVLMRSVRPDVTFTGLEDTVPASDKLVALDYPEEWVSKNSDLKAKLQDIIARTH